MTRVREEVLPPIIVDIVKTVLDDKNPMHVRENACGRLEQIAIDCDNVAKHFRAQQLNRNVRNGKRK